MALKVSFPWFMDGKEVELPDMKVEGSLAVADLTKKHADEFVPFVITLQEEAALRLRVNALSVVLFSKGKVTDDQYSAANVVLNVYNITPVEDKQNLLNQYKDLFNKLKTDLTEYTSKTAYASVTTTPFFLRRSLLEAYYMIKAYIWNEARKRNEKPKMPFTLEEMETLIDDPELSVFTKYSMTRLRKSAEEDMEVKEPETPEKLKKKLKDTPDI